MKLSDASPFIRFAFRFNLKPRKELFTALDCRLMYFHSGKGYMNIDGKRYRFEPHTIIIWQPGCLYRFESTDETLVISSINFDYTYERQNIRSFFDPIVIDNPENINSYNIIKTDFADAPELSSPLLIHKASKIEPKIAEIVSLQYSFMPFSDEKKTALFFSCIIDILSHNRQDGEAKKINKTLNTVLLYINYHFKEDISNETLANLVGYHPYYLNKLFNKNTGKTLHQYLISYRLEIAEQMLRTTEIPVASIAEECGFSSIISFETNFKKKNGMTPSEFRKTNF